jgi:hypothetical protein
MVFETTSLENRARSTRLPRMPHFAMAGVCGVQKIAALRERVIGRERPHISVVWNIPRMGRLNTLIC